MEKEEQKGNSREMEMIKEGRKLLKRTSYKSTASGANKQLKLHMMQFVSSDRNLNQATEPN